MPLPEIGLEETNFGRILEAVRLTQIGLGLPGIDPANIVISKVGWVDPERHTFPRIIIDPRPEQHDPEAGTNERDEIIYPVLVAIMFADGLDDTSRNMGLHLWWRYQTAKSLRHKKGDTYPNFVPITGTSFNFTTVDHGDVFIEEAKRRQYNAQAILGRFHCYEPR